MQLFHDHHNSLAGRYSLQTMDFILQWWSGNTFQSSVKSPKLWNTFACSSAQENKRIPALTVHIPFCPCTVISNHWVPFFPFIYLPPIHPEIIPPCTIFLMPLQAAMTCFSLFSPSASLIFAAAPNTLWTGIRSPHLKLNCHPPSSHLIVKLRFLPLGLPVLPGAVHWLCSLLPWASQVLNSVSKALPNNPLMLYWRGQKKVETRHVYS